MNNKNNILIVDDVPENLEILTDLLFSNGINVIIAENAEETFTILKKKTPDLILLDINLPGVNGFQICEKLKNNPKTKSIPIIFLTAKVATDDIIKGFELGAVDYITKPFNSIELLTRVKTHLDLKNSNYEIIRMSKSKDKFFSVVARDLKAVFLILNNFVETLKKKQIEGNNEEILKYTNLLYDTSKQGYAFLENLLEWARVQTGDMQFVPQKINLKNTIEPVFNLLRNTIAVQKGIIFYSMVTSGLDVFADEKMLQTIIRNLTSNALKYSNSGDEIIISAEEKNDFVEISVSDTGIGIDEEELENLFILEKTRSTEGTKGEKGTGLGLVLSKQLIEIHSGEISATSTFGQGSIFKFTIPKKNLKDF
jgi:signal transduction histidine kinase